MLRPSIRLPDGEERMRAEIPQFSQFAQPPLPLFVSRVWGGGQQWGTKPEPKPAAPHSPLSPSLPPPPSADLCPLRRFPTARQRCFWLWEISGALGLFLLFLIIIFNSPPSPHTPYLYLILFFYLGVEGEDEGAQRRAARFAAGIYPPTRHPIPPISELSLFLINPFLPPPPSPTPDPLTPFPTF